MRRRESGTNIFSLISKSLFESNAGRIRWQRNLWAMIGSRWDRLRVEPLGLPIVQEDHVLVHKPCVNRCPQPPDSINITGKLYFDGKWWHVPRVVCVQCQFHRASNRSFRFPRCVWKKETDQLAVAAQSMVQLNGMVEKAVEQAEQIVRGKV